MYSLADPTSERLIWLNRETLNKNYLNMFPFDEVN